MPFAELTDVRCFYQLSGQGDPLVLIPGLGSTSRVWDPVCEALGNCFSVIRLDNREIGQSVAKRRPRSVRDYSADLAELFDHLQINRAHLMGLSLGGVIAQCFAVEHPQCVSRLVLLSTADRFGPYLRERIRLVGQSRRWFPKPLFARTMEVLSTGPASLDANPQRVDERLRELSKQRVSGRALGRQLRALAVSHFEPDEYRILAPTLVICGEFDTLIPHCYGRQMATRIEDSRFMMIPDAGHNPISECPEKVLPEIIRFLQADGLEVDERRTHGRRRVA